MIQPLRTSALMRSASWAFTACESNQMIDAGNAVMGRMRTDMNILNEASNAYIA